MKLRVLIVPTALILTLLSLSAAPSWAACGNCYWVADLVGHGNQYATSGVNNDTGCDFPWGGSEMIVGIYLGMARDAGEEAYDLLLSAWQTCSCSTASSAKTKLLEAIDDAASAVSLCENPYCQDNDACTYAGSAHSWYSGALSTIDSCIDQACGASS